MTEFTLHRHAMIGFQPNRLKMKKNQERYRRQILKSFNNFASILCNEGAQVIVRKQEGNGM